MIKRELATRLAAKLKISARSVHRVLDEVVLVVADILAASGRLEWRGLGTFSVRTYPARKIHNPATGKTIALPARKSITYKPEDPGQAQSSQSVRADEAVGQARKVRPLLGRLNRLQPKGT